MNNNKRKVQAVDDERQMRNLVNAIRLSDDFSLLFVRCNQRPQQKEIIKQIEDLLFDYKIEVIFFEDKIENLLDEIQKRLDDKKPDAILVYGLESSFRQDKDAYLSPFVATLNHSRNSFKHSLSCPLVLFLPEFALSAIHYGATDFFSIRSGVYLFSAKTETVERQITEFIGQGDEEILMLPAEIKQEKIEAIKKLLAEYQSYPDAKRELEKEISLKNKLADFYYFLGKLKDIENIYQEVIDYARENEDFYLESKSLNNLGLVYQAQGRYGEAIEKYEEGLSIAEKTVGKEHHHYATFLNNLASVYKAQGRYEEAIEEFEEVLQIDEKTIGKEHPQYATHLNNLGSVYDNQGRHEEAIEKYEEALQIEEKTISKKHPYYANGLNNLASVYQVQGRYTESLSLFREAYQIYEKTLGEEHPHTILTKLNIENCEAALEEE